MPRNSIARSLTGLPLCWSDSATLIACFQSAAANVAVLVDGLAGKGAERAADQGPSDPVMAAIDHIAQYSAADRANDQACRAVVPLAIIAAVRATIDLVVHREPTFLVALVVAII